MQRDETDLKMNLGGLELKLHKVQFALCSQVLQSWGAAEAEGNLTAKCTECSFNLIILYPYHSSPLLNLLMRRKRSLYALAIPQILYNTEPVLASGLDRKGGTVVLGRLRQLSILHL